MNELMRVLLLNNQTGLYFQAKDSWTASPDAAMDFGGSIKAAIYAQEHCLQHTEIYLDFGDAEYNVHLPVPIPVKQA